MPASCIAVECALRPLPRQHIHDQIGLMRQAERGVIDY
jgi:hypothetical protein